jgi:NADH-quinone oxidoreductase subunit G
VHLKINGRTIEARAGNMVIQAAHDHGIHVPYFCYHPGLTPEGNCRMCLVEVAGMRKPVPSCMTPVAENMEVLTDSDMARAAQADVLEFMLTNHPLDCPICDKSGECMLQDHSYGHGKDHSRMVEPKELKPTEDLGADVLIWGNRCIVCTRCVRFCKDVAGTGELTVVHRGDHSVISVFPDYPLENDIAGNVVDICPVGALISKRFLYQARVWYEKKTDSVCNACARGCNIRIETLSNKIKRLVPRHNSEVNDYWMCDHGRWDFDHVLGPKRWLGYRLGTSSSPQDAARVLKDGLEKAVRDHGPQAVGGVASAFMTLEQLFLFRTLLTALGVPPENLAARARPDGAAQVFKGGFKISADKNPNRAGVRLLLGEEALGARFQTLLAGMRSGAIRALVVVNDMPHFPVGGGEHGAEILGLMERLAFAAVFLLESEPEIPASAALLPATAFSERDGTVINEDGRLQLLRPATQLPRGVLHEHEVLQEVLLALGARDRKVAPAEILKEIAAAWPELSGADAKRLGRSGYNPWRDGETGTGTGTGTGASTAHQESKP